MISRRTGDGHKMPAVGGSHARQEDLASPHGAQEVHIDDFPQVIGLGFDKAAADANPGAGEHQIDSAICLQESLCRRSVGVEIGDVEQCGICGCAKGGAVIDHVAEPSLILVIEQQRPVIGCQRHGQCTPDPTSGAGDDGASQRISPVKLCEVCRVSGHTEPRQQQVGLRLVGGSCLDDCFPLGRPSV